MSVTGKLIEILEVEQGEGQSKPWIKQSIVLQQEGEYGKPVCIMFWGAKVDIIDTLSIGDTLTIAVNIESREYNGRWYTDIKAWKVVNQTKSDTPEAQDIEPTEEDNDLPF